MFCNKYRYKIGMVIIVADPDRSVKPNSVTDVLGLDVPVLVLTRRALLRATAAKSGTILA